MISSSSQLVRPILAIAIAQLITLSVNVAAQSTNYASSGRPPDPGLELLQQEPHDLIYFKQESGGGWVKTVLLDFPGRTPPKKPEGNLEFQILGMEGKEFAAAWADIARVDLWEVRLEREARERIKKGDFVGGYPFLSVLLRDYPERSALKDLRSEFLWSDAISRARSGQLTSTLAMLEELRRYSPNYRSADVLSAIDQTIDRLMGRLIKAGETGFGATNFRQSRKRL